MKNCREEARGGFVAYCRGRPTIPIYIRVLDDTKQAGSEESMPQLAVVDQTSLNPDIVPPSDLPLYEEVLEWATTKLRPAGFPKPLCKRLAVIISGLVATEKATIGEVATAVEALALSEAKTESIARRLQRALQDSHLDPSMLAVIFQPLLPDILRSNLLGHEANINTPDSQHRRFIGIVIVFDESSQGDKVHLAVAGVPVGGVVLPLAIRTWPQNVPMPEGEYWTQIMGLLQDIQDMLPPVLREHVLLTADRLYGVPRMLDILTALRWNWLLRVQGQTQVRLENGICCALRTLVSKPGTQWAGGFTTEAASEASESEPIAVFKAAGWRRSQVVAVWAEDQAEPWLLVTSLTATLARVAEYAQRWAIERLFLSWKSHGWDVEASGIHDPHRLGRWLVGMTLATLWRLAMALPTAFQHLADLASRAGGSPRQPRLPGFSGPQRPWAAKYSLLTWGAKVARSASLRTRTPALCWRLPFWEARTWQDMCRHLYLTAHGQFPIFP